MSKRLDMRTHRYEGERGTPIVLLSIDVPDNMVLLSDSDMWHNILNDCYLELYEKDDIEYPSGDEKIKSWDNVSAIFLDSEISKFYEYLISSADIKLV